MTAQKQRKRTLVASSVYYLHYCFRLIPCCNQFGNRLIPSASFRYSSFICNVIQCLGRTPSFFGTAHFSAFPCLVRFFRIIPEKLIQPFFRLNPHQALLIKSEATLPHLKGYYSADKWRSALSGIFGLSFRYITFRHISCISQHKVKLMSTRELNPS